jgi:GxxExxY protein
MLLGNDTALTEQIIGCAMAVHKELGPGLLESVYEAALCIELRYAALTFKRQIGVPLHYRGELISEHRPDIIVDGRVIVEVKTVDRFAPIHTAQMLTYLQVTGLRTGVLLNFNTAVLRDGIRRVIR